MENYNDVIDRLDVWRSCGRTTEDLVCSYLVW